MSWTTGVRFPAEAGNFSLHHRVQIEIVSHLPPYPMGIEGSFPGELKRPGPEGDQLPSSIAEVKNAWSYTSTPNTSPWHDIYLSPGPLHFFNDLQLTLIFSCSAL
jgi:hypothetical protein